jgi:inhibitor of the pro-sigma K processing machinery
LEYFVPALYIYFTGQSILGGGNMEFVLAIGFIIIILLLLYNTMVEPMKIIYKVLIKFVIGALMIGFINIIGMALNFHIAINFITTGIAGILGLPGLLLLILLRMMA